ncbi:unnamed protein product, partial [marine sediment metagenome]
MKQTVFMMALNEALNEEMERDEKVFIIGEDVQSGVFGASRGLIAKYGPERVMDTPLSETAVAGAALGAATAGYRPVADFMFADFMFVAANEIVNNIANWHFIHGGKVNLPVVLFASIGGYVR